MLPELLATLVDLEDRDHLYLLNVGVRERKASKITSKAARKIAIS